MNLKPTFLAATALILIAHQPVDAAVMTFVDDFERFEGLTLSLTVEDFEQPDTFLAGLTFGSNVNSSVTFPKTGTILSLTPPVPTIGNEAATEDTFGATSGNQSIDYDGRSQITFSLPESVDAFAIDITSLFSVATPATYEVVLDGTTAVEIGSTDTDIINNTFNFALISDTPFSELTLRFTEGGVGDFVYLDTLQYGNVPEPSSLALLGLGGLIVARRLRGI